MPRYISVDGEQYGILSNEDGTKTSHNIPTTKVTAAITAKVNVSIAEHVAQAKRIK